VKKIMLVALLGLLACGIVVAEGTVTVKGSDTLVRLGQRWAEEYMKTHKGAVIQVSGGGSGTGIAALLNGSTDICEASRDMQPKEYQMASDKGIKPYRVAVALDGIAVFLNKSNPVNALTIAQLKDIYTGKITNWKEVGGTDARIILYSRENNSGTYAFFKEHVMKSMDYAPQAQNLPGTASVVNAISKDPNGIGYGGIAWETNVKAAAVKKDDTTAAVTPSVETVTNGTYPISRELYWFFNGTPTGNLKEVLNWALSPEGQKIAEEIDYVPLPKEVAIKNMVK
jgi:phosphate transport system substrate-binding protein